MVLYVGLCVANRGGWGWGWEPNKSWGRYWLRYIGWGWVEQILVEVVLKSDIGWGRVGANIGWGRVGADIGWGAAG